VGYLMAAMVELIETAMFPAASKARMKKKLLGGIRSVG
jgi:hypothetical protein